MKLKLDYPHTGFHGTVEFVDGVSVTPVSPFYVNMIRASEANVRILEDDGVTIDEALDSLPYIYPRAYYEEIKEPVPSKFLTYWDGSYPAEQDNSEEQPRTAFIDTTLVYKYERSFLEQVADQKGIAGLREIAAEHEIKGKSIGELIDQLAKVRK